MLVDMGKSGGLPWDCIMSAQMARGYTLAGSLLHSRPRRDIFFENAIQRTGKNDG